MAIYGGLQTFNEVKSKHIYPLAAGEAADIYVGDPIIAVNTGYVTVSGAAPTAPFVGAALGFFDQDMNPIAYYPNASYAVVCYVLVADHPEQEFIITEDAVTELALADCFANITFVAGTGDSTTGKSGYQLDSSEKSQTATDPVKIIRLAPTVGNTLYNATTCPNPYWIVKPNFCVSKDTTGI